MIHKFLFPISLIGAGVLVFGHIDQVPAAGLNGFVAAIWTLRAFDWRQDVVRFKVRPQITIGEGIVLLILLALLVRMIWDYTVPGVAGAIIGSYWVIWKKHRKSDEELFTI